MTELTIRPATYDDDAALALIDRETWSVDVSPAPPPAPEDPFFARREPEGVLVACADGAVVGYVMLRPPTRLAANTHVLSIFGLAVRPQMQGRGIAGALPDAAEGYARAPGTARFPLGVLASNPPARGVSARHGYRIEGVQPGEFLAPSAGGAPYAVDDLLMAKDLRDP